MSKNFEFCISVIIPVFNASKFIQRAVESAIQQKEVCEVILIEDGSTDNSYQICKKISSKFDQVLLFTHENRANEGAGESRNLGIKKAKYSFFGCRCTFYSNNKITQFR